MTVMDADQIRKDIAIQRTMGTPSGQTEICRRCGRAAVINPVHEESAEFEMGETHVTSGLCGYCEGRDLQAHLARTNSSEWQADVERKREEDRAKRAARLCFVCQVRKPFAGARWCPECAIKTNEMKIGIKLGDESDEKIRERIEYLRTLILPF